MLVPKGPHRREGRLYTHKNNFYMYKFLKANLNEWSTFVIMHYIGALTESGQETVSSFQMFCDLKVISEKLSKS